MSVVSIVKLLVAVMPGTALLGVYHYLRNYLMFFHSPSAFLGSFV